MKTIINVDDKQVILEHTGQFVQICISRNDVIESCLTLTCREAEMLRAGFQAHVDVLQAQDLME